jgi:hypothetical protein
MVPVLRAEGGFHARVVAARLGSEGIVTQLRGNVDGPYPMGAVEVLVSEDDLPLARGLLLADEVESSFDTAEPAEAAEEVEGPERRRAPAYGPWLLAVAVTVIIVLPLLSLFLR